MSSFSVNRARGDRVLAEFTVKLGTLSVRECRLVRRADGGHEVIAPLLEDAETRRRARVAPRALREVLDSVLPVYHAINARG